MTKPKRAPARKPMLIAAIDIGSNAVRFALARVSAGKLQIIEEKRRPTRLGANLAKGLRLPKDGIKATLGAVKEFCFDAMRQNASHIRLVATAAVRESPDGTAFVSRLTREVGLPVFVIGPDEEARLAFASCRAAFDILKKEVAIVDIGGGSVQASLARRGVLYESVSMPLGAVRLTAAFGGPEAVLRPDVLRRLRKHIAKVIDDALPPIDRPLDALIGCGGTFAATNLLLCGAAPQNSTAAINRDKPKSLARQGHDAAELTKLAEKICSMNLSARATLLKRSGVPADRADILPAGLVVASALVDHLHAACFVPHMGGVRDGILRELAAMPVAGGMTGEARQFAINSGYERDHSEHVAHLSVALLHDMADVDRVRESLREQMDATELLESAGLLHDLGVPIDYERHHKVSRRIVELAPWKSMGPESRTIVANIARYHRKSLPTDNHLPFGALSRRTKQVVRMLAGVLRVADGLDRDHHQSVHGVRVRITPKLIEIVAEGAAPDDVNVRAAQKKSDLLGAVTRRKIVVKAG